MGAVELLKSVGFVASGPYLEFRPTTSPEAEKEKRAEKPTGVDLGPAVAASGDRMETVGTE